MIQPPTAPPKLVDLQAQKENWEAQREEVFPRWKAALEAVDGNVIEEDHD